MSRTKSRFSVYFTVDELKEITPLSNKYSNGVLTHFVSDAVRHYVKHLKELKLKKESDIKIEEKNDVESFK